MSGSKKTWRGKLWKRRRRAHPWGGNWVKREFELADGVLSYGKTKAMELAGAAVLVPARAPSSAPTPFAFMVVTREQRWQLCATSDAELAAWRSRLAPLRSPSGGASEVVVKPPMVVVLPQNDKKSGDEKFRWHLMARVAACVVGALAWQSRLLALLVVAILGTRRIPAEGTSKSSPPLATDELEVRGEGLREVPVGATAAPNTWSKANASSFNVRQVGYAKTRQKAPSEDAIYEVVSVQVYDASTRIDRVAARLVLESNPSPDPDVPAIVVVNAQLPRDVGPLRADVDADGPGHSIVIVMRMTDRTRRELQDLTAVPAARRRALELLRDYCRLAPLERKDEPNVRGRFKVIAQIRNIDDVSLPRFATRYNGKPALVARTGTLYKGVNRGQPYLEMDINIHAFGYLARLGFHSLYHEFKHYVVSAGFTIEARRDAELPELILGACDLNFLS
ncbi:hypothetical protein CTAYLR_005439 [Chrysophaeum taylorii]|uniref:PH domain-containing protein n=1 Tax=Chrysophaeum taylorii TaxID=2483200 RepID=A0AAD7XNJ9_9STRA|nr:hypothetical protein CTAYLR_005439 [Chrysophaeum taylorii]